MKNILVVEDEVMIADELCYMLDQLHYIPFEPALTYQDAINTLMEQDVDMAILDINLKSKKTGIDLGFEIKERFNIPFIYLTSYSDTATLERARATQPMAYLVKPFEMADVDTALKIASDLHNRMVGGSTTKTNGANDLLNNITSTEKLVLLKISEQLSTREIADLMHVSVSTIKNHRHNISKKLNLPATTNSLLTWVLSHKEWLD